MQVKASGGIRDYATAHAMIQAGATRLGCSASAAIIAGEAVDAAAHGCPHHKKHLAQQAAAAAAASAGAAASAIGSAAKPAGTAAHAPGSY